nr:MAG: hypothetical protein CSA64_00215 [Arachnia propionica]
MAEVRSLRGPGVTACGQPVPLLANVGTPADAEQAAEAGAEGSGLFRTELAFLNAKVAPTRQQQTELYARVLAPFAGKPVTIRTLDAGADKPLAFADLGPEPNPALGRRGLRLCQERQDLLADQLGAIADAQAATGAVVKVMAPMVATAEETEWFVAQARTHGLEQAGVMVEIPAAALRAHDILAQCDFVSLGTNDLSQYALAADRMVGELSDLLDPWQPALLDLIAMTCDGAARLGKPVGVCGEAGGDPLAALVLVGLGVTTLSMAAAKLALVRYALSLHTLAQCRELAEAAREATSAAAARERVKQLVNPALAVLT